MGGSFLDAETGPVAVPWGLFLDADLGAVDGVHGGLF